MGLSIGAAADGKRVPREGDGTLDSMQPITFETPEDFRACSGQHHDSERELWIGDHEKGLTCSFAPRL
jgi:hypothetical protein